MTTSMEQHNCVACKEFGPEYELIAKSVSKSQPTPSSTHSLFFGVLDYSKGMEVFQSMAINNVPMLLRFPPNSGPFAIKEKYDSYEMSKNGFKAEQLAEYLEKLYNFKVYVNRPIDYTNYIITAIGVFFTIVIALALKDVVYTFMSGTEVWLIFVIAFSTINTGGYMWNTIRTPPFIANENGKAAFIAGGFQNQYGVETFIVAAIYAAVSYGFIALGHHVPQLNSGEKQRTGVLACLALVVVVYSILLALFRVKNGSYPFKLLF